FLRGCARNPPPDEHDPCPAPTETGGKLDLGTGVRQSTKSLGERYLGQPREIGTDPGRSLSCGEVAAAKPQTRRGHVGNPTPVSLTRPRSGRAVSIRG